MDLSNLNWDFIIITISLRLWSNIVLDLSGLSVTISRSRSESVGTTASSSPPSFVCQCSVVAVSLLFGWPLCWCCWCRLLFASCSSVSRAHHSALTKISKIISLLLCPVPKWQQRDDYRKFVHANWLPIDRWGFR